MNKIPIVYGSIISPYVRKVVITLNKKKIPYELKPLNPYNDSDKKFIKTLNPLGKLPIYQDSDFILSDSSVICAYLEKTFPEQPIYPENNHEYAKSLWFEEFADTQLLPSLVALFFNTVFAQLFNLPSNQDAVKNVLESTLPDIFSYLDKEINGTEFIVGNQLSIADISIGQLALIKFDFLDFKIDISKWKKLEAYINNISKNSLFSDVFTEAQERLNKAKQNK